MTGGVPIEKTHPHTPKEDTSVNEWSVLKRQVKLRSYNFHLQINDLNTSASEESNLKYKQPHNFFVKQQLTENIFSRQANTNTIANT